MTPMKKWRDQMGFKTQQQAGDALGMSKHHIGKIERGEHKLQKHHKLCMQYLWECHLYGTMPRYWGGEK